MRTLLGSLVLASGGLKGIFTDRRFLIFIISVFGLTTAQAQTTNTFTGASGGLWSTATNWSLGTVPTTSDPVLINSNTTVNVQANSSAGAITLSGNNARINVQTDVSLTASGITYTGTTGNNVPIYMDAGTLNLDGGAGSITTSGGVTSYLHVTNGQNFTAAVTYLAGIPASGQSTLNLNGGTFNAGTMIFNVTAGAYTNTFNLNSGGLLTADTIRRDFDGSSVTFNWNDGTIQNRTNASLTISRGANATQNMVLSLAGTGTHTFNADSGRTITVASTATLADKAGEQGTLVKAGAGELIFQGTNTYTGLTTINAGTLTLSSGSAIADS
ncbi:MAG: hypothetical protein EBV34_19070, partial [Betaproteobacteria bacterium]|nr:hypothetical protein [Betaproteobacteria bacterium]